MKNKILISLALVLLLGMVLGFFLTFSQTKTNKAPQQTVSNPTGTLLEEESNNAKETAITGLETVENIKDYPSYAKTINTVTFFSEDLKSYLISTLPNYQQLIEENGLVQEIVITKIETIQKSNDKYIFKFTGIEKQKYLKFNQVYNEEQVFNVTVVRKIERFIVTRIATEGEPTEEE